VYRLENNAFSLVEFLVGASIMAVLLVATSGMLKPLNQANRKARLLNTSIKVENIIRNGVYLQASYSDPSKFEIYNGPAGVLLAKHGVPVYVNETLTKSSLDDSDGFPIKTLLELVDYKVGGVSQKGVIYQVAVVEQGLNLRSLGVSPWPSTETDKQNYLKAAGAGSKSEATSTTITIPKRLAESTLQECQDGFLRGVRADRSVVCWKFKGSSTCPDWSMPVGYRMNDLDSSIEVLCQKMNRVVCPELSMTLTNPTTSAVRPLSMPNFLVLKELSLNDLYPPKNSGAQGQSQCESIVDFFAHDAQGTIPAPVVLANPISGLNGLEYVCPDTQLYVKNSADNSCSPTFNLSDIATRKPAWVISPVLEFLPAREIDFGAIPPNNEPVEEPEEEL
jgi:hypothetical protein